MADIIVAPNGNDGTGTGTVANPYATIAKADNVASSGDVIRLRGGSYNQRWVPSKNNLTLTRYQNETVVLHGVNNTNWVVDCNSRNNITVSNITINYTHALPTTDMAHVNVRGSSQNFKIQNCTIWRAWAGTGTQDYNSGRRDAGVRISANTSSAEVDTCIIHGFNKGVHIMNSPLLFHIHHSQIYNTILSNIHFAGNTSGRRMGGLIEYNELGHSFMEDNIQTNDASVPDNADPTIGGVIVRYNSLYFSGEQSIDLKNAYGFVIEYNTFRRAVGSGYGYHATRGLNENTFGTITKGSVSTRKTERHIIRHNLAYDNSSFGLLWEKTVYYNNTIINNNHSINGSNGTGTHAGSTPKWWAIRQREGQSIRYVGVKNNVFANHASCGMVLRFHISNQDMDLDYNVYVGELVGEQPSSGNWFSLTPTQYRARIAAMGWDTAGETNSVFTYPNVAALKMLTMPEKPVYTSTVNHNLQSDSPLRNAGSHLTRADGAITNSTQLRLKNPFYFQDGSGRSGAGDTIFIEGVGVRTITNINESTRICTLSAPATVANSARIWFGTSSTVNIGAGVFEGTPPATQAPTITSTAITTGTAGEPYSYQVTATGEPPPTVSLTAAPTGMIISGGLISWASPTEGSHSVTVQAANGVLPNATQSYTLVIGAAPPPPEAPTIVSTPVEQGTAAVTYSYQVQATGNPTPTYSLDAAPTGMNISSSTGLVTWASPEEGSHGVTVRATNGVSPDATQSYTLVIEQPPSPPSLEGISPVMLYQHAAPATTSTLPDTMPVAPAAILSVIGYNTTEETPVDNAVMGIGLAADNEGAMAVLARHGANPTYTRRRTVDDGYMLITNPANGGILGQASLTSMSTTQVVRTWPTTPASSFLFYETLFGCDEASMQKVAINTTEDGDTAVSLDFRPNLAFFVTAGKAIPGNHQNTRWTFGVLTDDGVTTAQRAYGMWVREGISPTKAAGHIATNRCAIEITDTDGSVTNSLEVVDLDETGFDLTTRDDNWSETTPSCLMLAMEFATQTASGILTSPTSTGAQSITGVGFKPAYVGFLVTLLPDVDSGTVGNAAGTVALGGSDLTYQFCTAWTHRHGSTAADTQTIHSRSAIFAPQHDGSTGLQATVESFGNDGFSLSWLNVLGAGCKIIWWAVEEISTETVVNITKAETTSATRIANVWVDILTVNIARAETTSATTTPNIYVAEYVIQPAKAVVLSRTTEIEESLSGATRTLAKAQVTSAITSIVVQIYDFSNMGVLSLRRRPMTLTLPGGSMASKREVLESPVEQGEDEEKTWLLDTTTWGGSPAQPIVTLKLVGPDGELSDVSDTHLEGETTTIGNVIVPPTVAGLERDRRYRMEYKWRFSGQVQEAYLYIVARE